MYYVYIDLKAQLGSHPDARNFLIQHGYSFRTTCPDAFSEMELVNVHIRQQQVLSGQC